MVSKAESQLFVSPTFVGLLERELPFRDAQSPDAASFGGLWFWQGYRHSLFGEDVVYRLCGTGISLTEDTIESQRQLRANQVGSRQQTPCLLQHASSKLEVLYAIGLSVSMHVAQQPILEDEQGPQALVLCATKDQCDELTFVLNQFCAELHLVVHNLFEPFPSMPAGKRAEVVVGTPTLWESVARLRVGTGDRTGLENLLSEVYRGRPPPTYEQTKWRPYSLDHVAQLVVFDLELQVAMGFGSLLTHVLSTSPPPLSGKRKDVADASLPLQCQLYVVAAGGDCDTLDSHTSTRLLDICRERSRRSRGGCAEISLVAVAQSPSSDSRKRSRASDEHGDEKSVSTAGAVSQCNVGVLFHNAVTHGRLCVDVGALDDFCGGVLAEADAFWTRFESDCQTQQAEPITSVLALEVAFICVPTGPIDGQLCVQETCVLARPSSLAATATTAFRPPVASGSRLELLFKHLEERFSGELFDGSVVMCSNLSSPLCAAQFHVLQDHDLSPVVLRELFNTDAATDRPTAERKTAAVFLRRSVVPRGVLEERLHAVCDARATSVAVVTTAVMPERNEDTAEEGFQVTRLPPWTFLKDRYPRQAFSVLALRGIAGSLEELCRSAESATSPTSGRRVLTKPLALFIVEECCQYGRVLSYYCYQQKTSLADTSTLGTSSSVNDNERNGPQCSGDATGTTASVFVEFESAASAVEAVRLFSYRFQRDGGGDNAAWAQQGRRQPRARLFRNATYYAGVELEADNASHDDVDDDFLTELSLLAEDV